MFMLFFQLLFSNFIFSFENSSKVVSSMGYNMSVVDSSIDESEYNEEYNIKDSRNGGIMDLEKLDNMVNKLTRRREQTNNKSIININNNDRSNNNKRININNKRININNNKRINNNDINNKRINNNNIKDNNIKDNKRINIYNNIYPIDKNRGKIVLLSLMPNESIYNRCNRSNCFAAMANDINARELVKLINNYKLDSVGIGGWDGIQKELVLDKYGNINNYNNNTKYVLAIIKNTDKEISVKNVLKPKIIEIIPNIQTIIRRRPIVKNIKEISLADIKRKESSLKLECGGDGQRFTNPDIMHKTLAEYPYTYENDTILPFICRRCRRPNIFTRQLALIQVIGKHVCGLSNCDQCVLQVPGLICSNLRNAFYSLVEAFCVCGKNLSLKNNRL